MNNALLQRSNTTQVALNFVKSLNPDVKDVRTSIRSIQTSSWLLFKLLKGEVSTWRNFNHCNVVPFYGFICIEETFLLVSAVELQASFR